MLISSEEVMIYHMNTSTGHRVLITYDKVSFKKQLDHNNFYKSQQKAMEELNDLVFTKFRCGEFIFEPEEKQKKASDIMQLRDAELIELIFFKNPFECHLIKRELKTRGLFDEDLYKMGLYGIDIAKNYAINMLKEKIK